MFPTRSPHGALTIVAVGACVLVGACGVRAETKGTPPTGPEITPTTTGDRTPSTAADVAVWPASATHGRDRVFLKVGSGPGVDGIITPRTLTIYADGTVVTVAPQQSDPQSRVDPEFMVSMVNVRGMKVLRDRLVRASLIGDDLPTDRVMPDGGSLEVTVRDGGREYRSEIADPRKHAAASELISQLFQLTTVVGEENVVTGPPMRAANIELATYRIPSGSMRPGEAITRWPVASVSPAPERCVTLTGPDADSLRRTVSSAPRSAVWSTESGELYGAKMRALLPDEVASCGR